jgi:two-component system response regulator MprA
LVVDDEPAMRDSLLRALEHNSYNVELAEDGQQALEILRARPAHLILLDVLMPRLDGLELCRMLRRAGDRTPILFLTARGAVGERVSGLDAGADDYVVKPFALPELLARMRVLLRRNETSGDVLVYEDVRLDPRSREVTRGDRKIDLTRTEFALLELFVRNSRQVLTRSVIFERIWGYDFGERSRSLEVYVGYLRRKLEAGGEARIIQTSHGVGYMLSSE